ncbi:hypothetical protein RclHR1_13250001 [Rhizophagus clarus]|uniref:Uncharacterized protein n=1 Tax=Rhizophagus clarus TaxID=94130 RepID=A0A2Z6QBC4_9GLOM|nr:hypothetical protein RclHR1_13250001 [Rhizophagus clarus]
MKNSNLKQTEIFQRFRTPIQSVLGISKVQNSNLKQTGSKTPIRSRLDPELHFKVNWDILKFRKPVFLTPVSKSADEFLEEILKLELKWNQTELFGALLQSFSDAYWMRYGILKLIFSFDFLGLQLSNTTGLNFEASERNFKGSRFPEYLIYGISEVCV